MLLLMVAPPTPTSDGVEPGAAGKDSEAEVEGVTEAVIVRILMDLFYMADVAVSLRTAYQVPRAPPPAPLP